MKNNPTTDTPSKEPPAPEVLKAQVETSQVVSDTDKAALKAKQAGMRPRHNTYRPSHKATFFGLAVVIVVLAINAAIIVLLMKSQEQSTSEIGQSEVIISPAVLDTLGVSRNTVGNTGAELVVNPNARFSSNMIVGGDISVAGQFKLNSKLTATDASLAKLDAGETTITKLSVSGDSVVSSLTLSKDLTVTGLTRLQGAVTVGQLLTVNNNVNISGNLAVGGVLSARGFQASSLVSDTTLTIGGHVITRGSAPGVSPGGGSALGTNGTVSISGNDASGTVAVNIGTGSSGGILATVSFVNQYTNIPHVVITAIGAGMGSSYVSRSPSGFSIGVNGPIAPGGYAFDYIVMQ